MSLTFNNMWQTNMLILTQYIIMRLHNQVVNKQVMDRMTIHTRLEVNSDYVGAESVSNIEYERRLQDKKKDKIVTTTIFK